MIRYRRKLMRDMSIEQIQQRFKAVIPPVDPEKLTAAAIQPERTMPEPQREEETVTGSNEHLPNMTEFQVYQCAITPLLMGWAEDRSGHCAVVPPHQRDILTLNADIEEIRRFLLSTNTRSIPTELFHTRDGHGIDMNDILLSGDEIGGVVAGLVVAYEIDGEPIQPLCFSRFHPMYRLSPGFSVTVQFPDTGLLSFRWQQ